MRNKRTRLEIGLALAAALLMRADKAHATLTYNSAESANGTEISFDPGTLNTGNTDALTSAGTLQTGANKNQPSLTYTLTATYPTAPSYQFSDTDTVKKSGVTQGSSVAKASAEEITNSTTAAVKVQAGTGVTQASSTTTHAYTSASDLEMDFDEFFTVGSTGAGPGVTGVASFALGGTIASGGSAAFGGQFTFYDDSESTSVVPATVGAEGVQIGEIDLDTTTFSTPGPFSRTFTASTVLNDPLAASGFLPAGALIEVVGYIDFEATDDDTTGITLTTPGGVGATDTGTLDLTPGAVAGVPEPGTIILAAMGIGSAGMSLLRRRKRV